MPTAKVQLEDGRIARFEVPEGTTQEQVMAFIQQNPDAFQAQSSAKPAGLQMPQDPFEGLSEETVRSIEERFPLQGSKTIRSTFGAPMTFDSDPPQLDRRAKAARLEQIRLQDPAMAAEIEETGTLDAFLSQTGRGLTAIPRALGLGFEEGQRVQQQSEQFREQRPAAFTGQVVGEAAPFAAAGGPLTAIGKTVAQKALIGGGLAATEGFTVAKAEGKSTPEAAKLAAFTAPFGAAAGFIPTRTISKQLIDPETNLPTPQFSKALKRRDIEFGTLLDHQGGLPLFSGARTPDQLVDDIIRQRISSGDQSGSLYRFRIANGRVIDDALGEEALKQGFRKGDIASAKGANPQTRARMRQMLNMKRQISADESRALNFRPTDVVGDSVMSRFQFLTDEARRLRLELDDIAGRSRTVSGRNLLESDASRPALAGRMIDTSKVSNRFSQGLDDLQIGFSIENRKPKFNFENSLISEDKTSQRVIRSVANILAKGADVDAQAAHLVKRQLDSMLDFNRSSASGLTDAGEKFAKNIRASVNESIRDVSPAYARINDDLSQILGTIDDFSGSLGRVDPFAENASAAVGQTMRRLLSNVQSRADLDTALINLDDAAARLGGEFPVDIKRLILFNKTLDDRFGATARGSFQGDIESALRSGPTAAAKDFVTKKAAEKIQDVRGISDEEAFNTMMKILNRDQ